VEEYCRAAINLRKKNDSPNEHPKFSYEVMETMKGISNTKPRESTDNALAAAHVPTTSASQSIARSANTILPDQKQHTAACTVAATSSADGASFFQPLRHPRHEHLPLQLHYRNLPCHPPSTEEANCLLPRWCLFLWT
jgi:hypothetical protein